MQSVEFNSILEENLTKGSGSFAFDLKALTLTEKLQPLHAGRRIPLSDEYQMDQGLRDLWNAVCDRFKGTLKPRDIP